MFQVFQEVSDEFNHKQMLRSGRMLRTLDSAITVAKRKSTKAMTEVRDMGNHIIDIFRNGKSIGGHCA